MFRNIYLNGCSFTAGHLLKDHLTWGHLIADHYNSNLFNHAVNGNSFDTIFTNSITHLVQMNSKETLVLIGLTWMDRRGFLFERGAVNISPADLNRSANYHHKGKWSTSRKISTPYDLTPKLIDIAAEFWEKDDKVNLVIDDYIKFYSDYITFDRNTFKNNFILYFSKLKALESFLKNEGFQYRFLDFPDFYSRPYSILHEQFLDFELDRDKIITINIKSDERYKDLNDKSSHPTAEQSVLIKEDIIKHLESE